VRSSQPGGTSSARPAEIDCEADSEVMSFLC
jgi:hypothetical protein